LLYNKVRGKVLGGVWLGMGKERRE